MLGGFPQFINRPAVVHQFFFPLYDDSLRLMERLVERDIGAKLYVYNDFSHAFLSVDMVVSECEGAIQKSI